MNSSQVLVATDVAQRGLDIKNVRDLSGSDPVYRAPGQYPQVHWAQTFLASTPIIFPPMFFANTTVAHLFRAVFVPSR